MLSADEILRDRYKIIRLLGQGGMGAVYEAHDSVFDTSVALKEIVVDLSNETNTKAQEMVHAAFEREAKLLAKINHETFPHVKDYFSFDNRQFLVMELVDGEDLAKMLKQRGGPFPVSDVLEWTDQMLDGLDYLHTQNPPIIHRDLKPQNLKLNSRGKIKLLDFGIAKGTETANANTVTDQTFMAATQNYSPIEQMLRVIDPTFLAVITHKYASQVEPLLTQSADTRSDIYALGATVYNLLTATSPIEAVKRGVDIWDGKPDPLQDPTTLNPAISGDLSAWLLKSMEILRENRFTSAAEMRSALGQINARGVKQSDQKTEVMHFQPQTAEPKAQIPKPTADESNSVETIAAPKLAASTGGSAGVTTSGSAPDPTYQPAQKKSNLKFLWLIPIFGLLLGVIGIGGAGAWYFVSNRQSTQTNSNRENTNTEVTAETETPGPESTPETEPSIDVSTPTVSDSPEASPEPSATAESTRKPSSSTPKPTSKPTTRPRATPKKRPTRKPTRRPTRKPTPRKTRTPRKVNDCIFTDDC